MADAGSVVNAFTHALGCDFDDLKSLFEVIYVGLPLNLGGASTQSTTNAIDLAEIIEDATGIQARLIDERLTTRSASNLLHSAGRSSKNQRHVIDAVAALLILEQAIALENLIEGFAGMSIEEARQIG